MWMQKRKPAHLERKRIKCYVRERRLNGFWKTLTYFSTFFCFSNSVFIKQLWLHLHVCKYSYQHITYLTARAVRNAKTSPNTDKTKNCARPYLTRSGHRSGSRKRRDRKLFVLATVLHDTWRAIRAAGQAIQSRSIYCSGSLLSIFGRFISFFFVFWFSR